ncbi:MAG: DNA-3-methyladenine glycosylase 2 family protein [Chitinophagaceae bacterium]
MKQILKQHGYPPMWKRTNTFQTLILIILEQQVSLASAFAAFTKLKQKIGMLTPVKVLALSDEELRSCYFSRQKTVYARELAKAFISKDIQVKKLINSHDDDIRTTLKKVKGIGDWTVDVYLLFALQRSDIFPVGDLAMIKALKEVKKISKETSQEKILKIGEGWRPYRSVATMILWHYYLSKRRKK